MRYVLIHYHFFKNAGSTVEYILDRSFGASWMRFDGSGRDEVLRNRDLMAMLEASPRILALSTHQLRHPVPKVEDYVFFDMVFLRDPIDRIYSIYKHFQREPRSDDMLSEMAKDFSLKEFVTRLMELHPHYVNDVQVNLLANGGDYRHPPGEWDLEAARESILRSAAPGVVDYFNPSLVAAQYFLRPAFPMMNCVYVPHNISSEYSTTLDQRLARVREACGKQVYGQLLALNQLDVELVKCARKEVARRFQLVPDHAQRLLKLEQDIALFAQEVGFVNVAAG